MPDARKPRQDQHSVLAQIIAIRLRQLEAESPDDESFIKKLGVGRGTYFDLLHARGNPTLRTVEKVAARLNQSVFGLIGFTDSEVRETLKRQGIDYDELQAALAERTAADDRIAAALRLWSNRPRRQRRELLHAALRLSTALWKSAFACGLARQARCGNRNCHGKLTDRHSRHANILPEPELRVG